MAKTYVEVETDESKTPTLAERLKSVIGTAQGIESDGNIKW